MANLAIKGHATRGKEVIEVLEMLGGINKFELEGNKDQWYVLDECRVIRYCGILFEVEEKGFTLEEFLEKFPYKVGDKVKVPYEDGRITGNELYEYKILKIRWDSFESMIKYGLPSGDEQRIEYYSTDNLNIWNKEETMEKIKIDIPKGYEFSEVDNDKQQVVFTKIQPQYPKTYEECCEIRKCDPNFHIDTHLYSHTLISLYKLLICRDAYWKLAGWSPKIKGEVFYIHLLPSYLSDLFPFPTEEMKDEFYNNFKEQLDTCKSIIYDND